MWFADKKGLCSGVLMMGFGASALVLGNAMDAMINSPAMGWRAAFKVLGVALGVMLLGCGMVIKRPESGATEAKKGSNNDGEGDYTTAEMLKSATFYKAFILIVFLAAVGNTVISMARDVALSVGIAASTATTLVGVLSLCNGLGRVITGAVFDKLGRRRTMLGANIAAICAAGITMTAVLTNSQPLCIVGLCLTGLSYGTCPTITSAFASEVFGTKHFAANFSIMNCNILFASFIATGAAVINSAAGGYAGSFMLLLMLSTAALVLNLSLKK